MVALLCLAMGLTPVMGGGGRWWPVTAEVGGEKPWTTVGGELKQSKGEGLGFVAITSGAGEVRRLCVMEMGVSADVDW